MCDRKVGILIIVLLFVWAGALFSQSQILWQVDDQGNITKNGEPFQIRGASWTGLQGREEMDKLSAMGQAPMEMYIGNVFWAESSRNYDSDIAEIKAIGFNTIRLPLVPQTLNPKDSMGRAPYLDNADSVQIENSRLALETVIKKLDEAGIYVVLDLHSCSNYVSWRAGRLDARPPYPDKNYDKYDFLREDCSCAQFDNPNGVTNIQKYSMAMWLNDLQTLAALGDQLGVSNIMGIDIFNEPFDYSWEEWRYLVDEAYAAILPVNTNILIFVEGVSSQAGVQNINSGIYGLVPHGDPDTKPSWGENLFEAGENAPNIPKDHLVYSPHCFGPSIYVQSMFVKQDQVQCQGLEGDAVGDMKCSIIINRNLLEKGWDEHFGYLKKMGYAVVIGAFGGNPTWPNKAELRDQDRYSYLNDKTVDWQWQNVFVDYLISRDIRDSFYWAINPEEFSSDGIFTHAYDPVKNEAAFGIWLEPDAKKLELLKRLWEGKMIEHKIGDVNNDSFVNIIDALLIAQYYVALPVTMEADDSGDVNCDGKVNIIDALLVAQHYVGLRGPFFCI
ncbi:MAG: cellulase family glycosylhydrolase [Spirochaetales bacterium]|nr:cellulase family glycosylhydrolase [Spirochaetales bacterium]